MEEAAPQPKSPCKLELRQNSSPRVLRFQVCHCDVGCGADDLCVLADDGLKGFVPVNHGTKHQRLEDHRGENKHGHGKSNLV